MSTGQMALGIITVVLAIVVAVAGATWVILEEINESHVELQKQISESHVELQKQINESRVEFHKEIGEVREEIGEVREEIGELRGDIEKLDSKLDEFKESHEREHDLFYDAASRNGRENSTSAN